MTTTTLRQRFAAWRRQRRYERGLRLGIATRRTAR